MKLLRIVTMISLFSVGIAQARLVFTTIDSPGFYRLSDELDNSVTVEVSDVTFDLNGHTITADTGIIINPGLDSVTIMNGTIQATTDGVISYTGSTGITLDNVRVEGAMRGITFDGVTGGLIKNCEMTMNTTGLLLDASHKITVKDCIANCNTHAGYDLLSSTTNCFENCKALSTGEGNTDIDSTTVFGFVSDSGYGNIFERCIANSTQALSVTGSSSLIAGFALRGSEGCTKIIDSESANTQTNVSGFTVPYGILLENSFDSTQSVTGALGSGTVTSVDWSSDGKYVAVSGSNIVAKEAGGDDLIPTLVQIYSFDRERGDFACLTKAVISSGLVTRIAWSPSGEYLALQFSGELQVYSFDKVASELSLFSSVSVTTGDQQDIAWSVDERFIAVAGDDGFVVYLFDRVTGEFESTAGGLDAVNAISFTPDGRYVAIGTATGSGTQLYVIEINPTTGTIIFPFISELGAFADIRSVDWSPDGHYLVVGGANIITPEGNGVEVFQHDRDAVTLTNIVGDLVTTGTIFSTDWSPDGQYIAVGGSSIGSGTGDDFQILEFDRAAQTLQVRDGALGVSSFIFDTKWSPDGQYIAVGGVGIAGGSGDLFQIMTGLQFPSKNVITGNTVYCNSGNQFPNGVGISGSSIANMIIGNTAFNNPLATAKDKPIVGSNYQFGTNTFNQLFGQSPGDTQNISLDGCDPLCTPNDIPMLIRQTLFKVCGMDSQLDVIETSLNDTLAKVCGLDSQLDVIDNSVDIIESKVCGMDSQLDVIESSLNDTLSKVCEIESQQDVMESKIDSLGECGPTPISSDDVSGGVLTLSDSGNYCLTEDITANVFITGTDITFDLNQREVTGTFTLQSFLGSIPNQVAVKNGAILAPGPGAAATPEDPPAAAVSIAVTGALIENVSILCGNSSSNVPGRSGIEVAVGGPVSIKDCAIQSGTGGLNSQTVDGLDGGHGIWLRSGREVFIDGCIIETGSGGRTANVASAIAGNGGSGVLVDGSVSIVNITDTTVVSTGDGGEGGGSSNTGGEGGHGIAAQGTASEVSVQNCTILSTGDGGAGTGTTSTGGDAGHGVFIASTASDVSVRNCTIQQTGDGGTGTSTAGAPGKAIDDDVTTTASLSQIFANFAHNIANSTKFDLQAAGEAGILTPNPPTATVINPFANVYSS